MRRLMSIYFMQLSKIRGAANGKTETSRGRRSIRKYEGIPARVSLRAAGSDEKRSPKSIIQEGKNGLRDLMIVFMEIRKVTEFSGEI